MMACSTTTCRRNRRCDDVINQPVQLTYRVSWNLTACTLPFKAFTPITPFTASPLQSNHLLDRQLSISIAIKIHCASVQKNILCPTSTTQSSSLTPPWLVMVPLLEKSRQPIPILIIGLRVVILCCLFYLNCWNNVYFTYIACLKNTLSHRRTCNRDIAFYAWNVIINIFGFFII